jgi:hypothetical protein
VILERAVAGHASEGLGGVAAYDVAFWWSIALTVAAVVLALWLPSRPPS